MADQADAATAVAEETTPETTEETTQDSVKDTSPLDITEPEDVEIPSGEDAGDTTEDAEPGAEAKATEVEDEADEFDEALLARAKEAGLSEKEIKTLDSPESLERLLDLSDRQLAALVRKREATEQGQDDSEKDSTGFDLKLDREVFDAEMVDAITGMNDHTHARISALEKTIKTMETQQQLSEERSVQRRFDGQVKELGDEFKDVFGGNRVGRQNRIKLRDEIHAMREGYRITNRDIPSDEDLFNRALRSEFGDLQETIVRNKVKSKVKTRTKQIIQRPTSRGKVVQDPTRTAEATVAQWNRDHGVDEWGDVEDDETGLI